MQCEAGFVYQACGDPCPQTCENLGSGAPDYCVSITCNEGCYCPNGTVNNGTPRCRVKAMQTSVFVYNNWL